MEAWAKRAWLASLDSQLWDYFMGKVRVVLEEDCIKGDDVVCDALSREEEAKREYFAQVDAPAQVCTSCPCANCTSSDSERRLRGGR